MRYVLIAMAASLCVTVSCLAYASGDLDHDGFVDANDVMIFSSQWLCGTGFATSDPNFIFSADLDGSYFVNFTDFAILTAQWYPHPPLTISGSAGVAGVVMTGLPGDPVTSTNGLYSVTVPYGWHGDVVPTKFGQTFVPPSRSYPRVIVDETQENYVDMPYELLISGNAGIDGVKMVGLPGEPVTGNGGNYIALVPYGWSGVVTPALAGYSFSPAEISYDSVVDDMYSNNYSVLRPTTENCVQWRLDDNSESSLVVGSEFNGQFFDGASNETAAVSEVKNGIRALHLNGGQYQFASFKIPTIWPSALANKWDKYAGNPVIRSYGSPVQFGQIVKNPSGGYYFFGCSATGANPADSVYRWSSTDLIRWTNKTLMLPSGGYGAWDRYCQVASAFQKPDGTWAMLYRGYDGQHYRMGKAVSPDGTNWSRVGNGPLDQVGLNYDPVGIMMVDGTYYVWMNGDYDHGIQNLYTSTDFEAFTRYGTTPLFNTRAPGDFCASPWYYNGFYYLLIPQDFVVSSSKLNDHALALYRSPDPTFDISNRDFLGYPIVNDQPYDKNYLDTPSVPVMDLSRTYSTEFGDTLYCMYDGNYGSYQNLAYTSLSNLAALKPKVNNLIDGRVSYSFWVNFDTLTLNEVVFSVARTSSYGSPIITCSIRNRGSDKVLALYVNYTFAIGSIPLDVNQPYHVVISDNGTTMTTYINGIPDAQTTARPLTLDNNYLFIGSGYGSCLDGYIWDFRIYGQPLSTDEVNRLYTTGTIVDPNAP
jgi:hypothetical protein